MIDDPVDRDLGFFDFARLAVRAAGGLLFRALRKSELESYRPPRLRAGALRPKQHGSAMAPVNAVAHDSSDDGSPFIHTTLDPLVATFWATSKRTRKMQAGSW